MNQITFKIGDTTHSFDNEEQATILIDNARKHLKVHEDQVRQIREFIEHAEAALDAAKNRG